MLVYLWLPGELICEVSSFSFLAFTHFRNAHRQLKDINMLNVEKRSTSQMFDMSKYIKRIFKITLPVSVTSYVRSGLSTLKQLLIPLRLEKSGMSCEYSLSVYGTVTGMVMPILMFPGLIITSFSNLLIPEYTCFYVQKSYTNIKNLTSKIFKIASTFSIACSTIFFYFSDKISLTFYKTIEISIFLKVMSILAFFIYIDIIIDNILKGLDKQLAVMVCNILDLFVSISFIYFILPIYGLNGYIAIIFISEILNFSISFWHLKKSVHLRTDFKNWIIKPLLCAILSCFIMGLFKNIDNLFISIAIFVGIYSSILIATSCLTYKDLKI